MTRQIPTDAERSQVAGDFDTFGLPVNASLNLRDFGAYGTTDSAVALSMVNVRFLNNTRQFRGTFTSASADDGYGPGDIVIGSDSRIYRLSSGNGQTDPGTNPAGWDLINPDTLGASAHSTTASYDTGSLVYDTGGALYVATQSITAGTPLTGGGWTQVGGRGLTVNTTDDINEINFNNGLNQVTDPMNMQAKNIEVNAHNGITVDGDGVSINLADDPGDLTLTANGLASTVYTAGDNIAVTNNVIAGDPIAFSGADATTNSKVLNVTQGGDNVGNVTVTGGGGTTVSGTGSSLVITSRTTAAAAMEPIHISTSGTTDTIELDHDNSLELVAPSTPDPDNPGRMDLSVNTDDRTITKASTGDLGVQRATIQGRSNDLQLVGTGATGGLQVDRHTLEGADAASNSKAINLTQNSANRGTITVGASGGTTIAGTGDTLTIGSINTITGLTDTPSSFGTAGQVLKVNTDTDGLVFADDDTLTVTATAPVTATTTGNTTDVALSVNTSMFQTVNNRLEVNPITLSSDAGTTEIDLTGAGIGTGTVSVTGTGGTTVTGTVANALVVDSPEVATWARTESAAPMIPLAKLPNLQLGNTYTYASQSAAEANLANTAIGHAARVEWHTGDLLVLTSAAGTAAGIYVYITSNQNTPAPVVLGTNFRAVVSSNANVQTTFNDDDLAAALPLNNINYSAMGDTLTFTVAGQESTVSVSQVERVDPAASVPLTGLINRLKIGGETYQFGDPTPAPTLRFRTTPIEVSRWTEEPQVVNFDFDPVRNPADTSNNALSLSNYDSPTVSDSTATASIMNNRLHVVVPTSLTQANPATPTLNVSAQADIGLTNNGVPENFTNLVANGTITFDDNRLPPTVRQSATSKSILDTTPTTFTIDYRTSGLPTGTSYDVVNYNLPTGAVSRGLTSFDLPNTAVNQSFSLTYPIPTTRVNNQVGVPPARTYTVSKFTPYYTGARATIPSALSQLGLSDRNIADGQTVTFTGMPGNIPYIAIESRVLGTRRISLDSGSGLQPGAAEPNGMISVMNASNEQITYQVYSFGELISTSQTLTIRIS